ncbi:hypothetical protein PRIPAC_74130 [Pristionchus pacificus]|uniref:Uncharacterized protein n=1 Tax=Pristionchus pacificus TaxID=54126 RepID=A0A2A6BZP7_PRIPA|nr:hypothetical protein PRIPAC_74130 [Pristionchus pacificus]|eukprot:PDM71414.1 hypothetical protein PRIPAC_37821 [Pristionchus pacificus]
MYLRRDLMPSELNQEKISREEARKRNNEAGCLKWGVRDCDLIKFRGPNYRPLPTGYRNLKDNEVDSKDLPKSTEQAKAKVTESSTPISNQSNLNSNTATISTTDSKVLPKSTEQAKAKVTESSTPISNQSNLNSNTATISTTVPTVTTKSTSAPSAEFVTTRKKEEDKSSTSTPLSTGGTTAKGERAPSLH